MFCSDFINLCAEHRRKITTTRFWKLLEGTSCLFASFLEGANKVQRCSAWAELDSLRRLPEGQFYKISAPCRRNFPRSRANSQRVSASVQFRSLRESLASKYFKNAEARRSTTHGSSLQRQVKQVKCKNITETKTPAQAAFRL